jgi:hypothetical protein
MEREKGNRKGSITQRMKNGKKERLRGTKENL